MSVGSNWTLLVVNIASTYVLTPFVIRSLGNDGYGVWTLMTAILSYVGLLALGVPMTCVRYLTKYLAEGDVKRANATIGSCAVLYLVAGAAALVVAGGLAFLFRAYDIPQAREGEAYLSFALMAVYVSVGFVALLPEGIMFAHHDFVLRNVVRIAAVLLRFGLTLVLLSQNASLVLLALVQLTSLAFDFGVSWRLIRRRYPEIRISLADFDWALVRQIARFGAHVMLLAAGARLAFETDAIVIGAFIDIADIPFYVIANSLVVYLMDFVVSIAAVVSPTATRLHTEGRIDELRAVYLKWSKVALSLTLVAGLFLVVLGPQFISWWIDPSFERPSGRVLQILMLSGFLFLPMRGVAVPVLMGMGKSRIPAFGSVAGGLANIALSIVLAGPLGLVGVALGTAIPNVLLAILFGWVACRELEIGVVRYLGYVVPRAVCGALPILALLLWFRLGLGVESLPGLATAGLATAGLFGVTWITFVYRRDPLVDLTPHLARIRVWERA